MSPNKPRRDTKPVAKPKTRSGKLSGGIIALSSAAIVSIYALGRANTSAGSDPLVDASPVAERTIAPAAQAAVVTPGAGTGTAPAAAPTATQAAPSSAYKDGTYTGSGTSRHGGMKVSVVIKDGKIASANVSACSTRYPCSDINPLIKAAVSKQAVPTNHVSGATDSSQAYKQALTNALQQASA